MQKKHRSLNIINAHENNLKGISLKIPHDELVAITGLSGSGKSSLAFDTVYAEGQRRYIETFSPYTRQFLDKVKKPAVELIENVRPAIAIQQRVRITNSRSTVGSVTNINDYLKILWSNLAEPYCPTCDVKLQAWNPSTLSTEIERLLEQNPAATILLGFPLRIDKKKKALENELDRLRTLGFNRWFNPRSGSVERFDDETGAKPEVNAEGEILIILERLRAGSFPRKRVQESIEQCFSLSQGTVTALEGSASTSHGTAINWITHNFYSTPRCEAHDISIEKPRPALFSFNHPYGACTHCKGFGSILKVDPALCVPNPMLSIKDRALQCWTGKGSQLEFRDLLKFCEKQKISIETPWQNLPQNQRELIFSHKSKEYWGVNAWFQWLERKTYKMHVRVFLSRYRSQVTCPECAGTRLKRDAQAYRIQGKTLPELWLLSIDQLVDWLEQLQSLYAKRNLPREVRDMLHACQTRLKYLVDLGLPYLTLDRQARTLSGGETQRVNLAAALGSDLVSTHFVLDEPSVGLHPRDTRRLIKSIRDLNQRGNSLLVVEHDLECLHAADHIVELGPKAGEEGGEVVYNGTQADWFGVSPSKLLPSIAPAFQPAKDRALTLENCTARNLKAITVKIPLERFVCITGVSGSGKSSLVREVLERRWNEHTIGLKSSDAHDLVRGFNLLEQVIIVDQSPLSKSPRANISTYTEIWSEIRDLLARTEDAQTRALSRSSFSFNVDGGRCPACSGSGFIREDMQFLSDVYIECDTCLGQRFQPTVLEVKLKGYSVSEILQMSIERAAIVFHDRPHIREGCEILTQLGLGHLTLGHPLSELSGGEAQRLKLVPFVQKSSKGRALLIFDEPTTGLHLRDVERLIGLLRSLVERGHSVLCVEHNLTLIAAADWLIDLGPEGGEGGGQLLAEGKPHELASKKSSSETIQYLREHLQIKTSQSKKKSSPLLLKKVEPSTHVILEGAREHNLKDISLKIPLNTLIALTGVSGSGKSSIAKDIIYAEGQRRYLDCLSPYARQFIKELKRPEIDSLRNIPPTICVYQHTFQPSSLSTVGTMSEAYNFLRLLYAKTGIQYCPDHPAERIAPLSPEEIAQEIKKIRASTVRVLAPIIKLKKGLHKPIFERAIGSEILEVRVDGTFAAPSRFEEGLAKTKPHTIEYVVAKFNPSRIGVDLILEAVQQGLSLSGGTLIVHYDGSDTVLSTERTCPTCRRGFFKPDPEDLSFHSKRGRCESCNGTGATLKGAQCPSCEGTRINSIGRNLRLAGKNIYEASSQGPEALKGFLLSLALHKHSQKIAEPVLRELFSKLDTLTEIGLEYLPLSRDCITLSGGELQRLRLATAMGSPLSGVLYIFDEPSVGLHPIDTTRVLERLLKLKESGNSVIVIEHDAQTILSCEYMIDVGPGGGTRGGEIVFEGDRAKFLTSHSPTARALQEGTIASPRVQSAHTASQSLDISIQEKNNLKNLSLTVPLQSLVSVCGVSGAGKSSLVHGAISETLLEGKQKGLRWSGESSTISSSLEIDRVLLVDQKPIGANARSTPASYLGIWDEIRKLFAFTIEAKSRGWKLNHFSYNTGKGRCPECKGQGQIKLEMNFLPDSIMECETCWGKRFSDETLSVLYQGLSVADVLNLTFEEARSRFAAHRKIHHVLHQACELGIGYLTLGQSSATLSGGESQRIKLVNEISLPRKKHTLYLLDEPTTGLHKSDVGKLVKALQGLVAHGHSVILIEHDQDVIAASDWVIELGPGAGAGGGKVIFQGVPEALQTAHTPWGVLFQKGVEATPAHAQG